MDRVQKDLLWVRLRILTLGRQGCMRAAGSIERSRTVPVPALETEPGSWELSLLRGDAVCISVFGCKMEDSPGLIRDGLS